MALAEGWRLALVLRCLYDGPGPQSSYWVFALTTGYSRGEADVFCFSRFTDRVLVLVTVVYLERLSCLFYSSTK